MRGGQLVTDGEIISLRHHVHDAPGTQCWCHFGHFVFASISLTAWSYQQWVEGVKKSQRHGCVWSTSWWHDFIWKCFPHYWNFVRKSTGDMWNLHCHIIPGYEIVGFACVWSWVHNHTCWSCQKSNPWYNKIWYCLNVTIWSSQICLSVIFIHFVIISKYLGKIALIHTFFNHPSLLPLIFGRL